MIIKNNSFNILLDTIGNLNEIKSIYGYVSISNGSIDPLIIFFRLLNKRVARVFIGTDVLKCMKFWDYRIRVKFCSFFCDNWAISEWLVDELNSVGIRNKLLNHENLVLLTKISPFKDR